MIEWIRTMFETWPTLLVNKGIKGNEVIICVQTYIHNMEMRWQYVHRHTYIMCIRDPRCYPLPPRNFLGVLWVSPGCMYYLYMYVIYLLWWLCNHRNLSIARWSCIHLNRLWAKMASFWKAFSGRRFVCCVLTIVYVYYTYTVRMVDL